MPKEGVGPSPCCQDGILNPARLPVPPLRLFGRIIAGKKTFVNPKFHPTMPQISRYSLKLWSGPSPGQNPSNWQAIGYKHDVYGRRSEKKLMVSLLNPVDGYSTRYLYDGDPVIAEYDGNNPSSPMDAGLRKYIYSPGMISDIWGTMCIFYCICSGEVLL
jgi:hypothetical protein